MSHHAQHIARDADVLRREVVEFVSGLSPVDLSAGCDDDSGDTVEHVLTHMQDGVPQVLGWFSQALAPTTAHQRLLAKVLRRAPGHGHQHGHGHDHGHRSRSPRASSGGSRPADLAADLDASLSASVRLVSQLSDADLDRVPPPAPGVTDGTLSVRQIVSGMIEHQRDHVRTMERAVAADRASRGPRP
jgi:hypothetical protein